MTIDPAEFEHIMADPSAAYKAPEDVPADNRLSYEQQIKILKQWAYDEREIEVAEEENMRPEAKPTILDRVLVVLHQLEESYKVNTQSH